MDKRILIVEDNPDARGLIARMLDSLSNRYEIEGVQDGENALARLKRYSGYAVIIIDLSLPDTNGIELLQTIQAEPELAAIPCVAITFYDSPGLEQEVAASGFAAYFIKPFDRVEFLKEVERLLGH